MNCTLLIIAHGSRSQKWNGAVLNFVDEMQRLNQTAGTFKDVTCCFLEYAQPAIPEAIQTLCGTEIDVVFVLPFFLSVSHHVLLDIPAEINKVAESDSHHTLGVYTCMGKKVVMLNSLNVPFLLARNLGHRLKRVDDFSSLGVIVVYYGTQNYLAEWDRLAKQIQEKLTLELPEIRFDRAYAGEAAGFSPDSLAKKLAAMGKICSRVCVLPALVAKGVIQATVIPQAIEQSGIGDRILYFDDAILPDMQLAAECFAEAGEQRDQRMSEML